MQPAIIQQEILHVSEIWISAAPSIQRSPQVQLLLLEWAPGSLLGFYNQFLPHFTAVTSQPKLFQGSGGPGTFLCQGHSDSPWHSCDTALEPRSHLCPLSTRKLYSSPIPAEASVLTAIFYPYSHMPKSQKFAIFKVWSNLTIPSDFPSTALSTFISAPVTQTKHTAHNSSFVLTKQCIQICSPGETPPIPKQSPKSHVPCVPTNSCQRSQLYLVRGVQHCMETSSSMWEWNQKPAPELGRNAGFSQLQWCLQ